jgi:hypothetical protein
MEVGEPRPSTFGSRRDNEPDKSTWNFFVRLLLFDHSDHEEYPNYTPDDFESDLSEFDLAERDDSYFRQSNMNLHEWQAESLDTLEYSDSFMRNDDTEERLLDLLIDFLLAVQEVN